MTQVETHYASRNCASGLLWEGICKADSWLLGGYLLGETPEIRYTAQRHHIRLTFLASQHLCLTISDSAALRASRHFCSGLTEPFARETCVHAHTSHNSTPHYTRYRSWFMTLEVRAACFLRTTPACEQSSRGRKMKVWPQLPLSILWCFRHLLCYCARLLPGTGLGLGLRRHKVYLPQNLQQYLCYVCVSWIDLFI